MLGRSKPIIQTKGLGEEEESVILVASILKGFYDH